MFRDFYRGKRVFVTGHTGFKGSWACLWLRTLGAEVTGYALTPPTDPNLFEITGPTSCTKSVIADIRDAKRLASEIAAADPDVVFHMAAQPIVRRSYAQPIETLETNVNGTANVLEAVRSLSKRVAIVVVTSDKCYENREWEFAYRETDALGGKDPYSMSKAGAELVAHSWNHSFFLKDPWIVRLATGRAGNVIGGGDYADDRLIPDTIRGLSSGTSVIIRNPASTRPWQHVLESVSGYLWLGATLYAAVKPRPQLEAMNFGPGPAANRPVRDVVDEALKVWSGDFQLGRDPNAPREATNLNVAIDRASSELGWVPAWSFATAVRETMLWYKARHADKRTDMTEFSVAQIESYARDARAAGSAWAVL